MKTFLVIINASAGYGFYLLLRGRVKSRYIALLGGIAFAFTPYIFIRTIVGFISSLVAYAVLPFFVRLFLCQTKRTFWHYLILGFLLSLIFAQIQAGILTSLFVGVYFVIGLFSKQPWKDKVLPIVYTFLAFVLVNLPWIALTLFAKKSVGMVAGGSVTTLQFIGSLPHSLSNVLMLSDHHITYQFFYPFGDLPIIMVGFILIYLIAALSLFNEKNRALIFSLIITALICLPFTLGPTGIFAGFYTQFYNHFPIIAVFRETYHFQFILSFILITLFAFGLDTLLTFLDSKAALINRKLPTANYRLLALLSAKTIAAGLVLIIIAPYLTFDYAGYLKLQKIPSSYFELHDYFQSKDNACHYVYYPPNLGFNYFKSDKTPGASNSDIVASSLGVPYLTDGSSVLNLPSDEMFYRNQLTSQFYEKNDNGEFASLLNEKNVDCVVLRLDMDNKYEQVSSMMREKDTKIFKKWYNQDFLGLMSSKKNISEIKKFGDNIYIYKPEKVSSQQSVVSSNSLIEQFPPTANSQLPTYLPITDWANNFAYYKDGWSRGRYDFWRKHLFAELRQDFLYTDKLGDVLHGKITQTGTQELWVRYLTGGTAGSFQIETSDKSFDITKDQGAERFVWKDLGQIDITDGNITITNIEGENAIADLVLVGR